MMSSVPILISLAIIMVASLFRFFFKRWQDTFPLVKQSDRVYLYCVGARLFIPVTIYGLFMYVTEMVMRYQLLTVTDIHEYYTFGSQLALLAWYTVRLFIIGWMILALWNSTAAITNCLQLKGDRKGRRVRGRSAVAIRLFSAQHITLFVARLVFVSILIVYYALNA